MAKMDDSILGTIRKKFGGQFFDDPTEASPFDDELITDINSALMILSQIGIGESGFTISGPSEEWDEFIVDSRTDLELVKTDVFMRVKLMFDPPASSVLINLYNDQIREYEWRLQTRAEHNI